MVYFDTAELKEQVKLGVELTKYFIVLLCAIFFILGYVLVQIFFSNLIRENLQDVKVLRGIGLSQKQLEQVYLIETLTVVGVSNLIGLVLGLILSSLLVHHIKIFLRVDESQHGYDWALSFLLILTCLISTLRATKSSLHAIKDRSINDLTRV